MSLKSLLELDARLTARLRRAEQPGPLRTASIFLGHTGDSWFWLFGLTLVVLFAAPFWQRLAAVMVAAIFVTATLVLAVKFTVRRARPEGELGQIYRKTDPHSFPSGHAARAFMLAVTALGLGPPWFGLTLLVWAVLVGFARVGMGVHYLSDVLAGWLLGGFLGLITIKIGTLFFL